MALNADMYITSQTLPEQYDAIVVQLKSVARSACVFRIKLQIFKRFSVIILSAGGDSCNAMTTKFLSAAERQGMMTNEYVYIITETNDMVLDPYVCSGTYSNFTYLYKNNVFMV
jgi:hypothetical protein